MPQDDSEDIQESLGELEALLTTLGIITAGRVIQKRQKFTPDCLLGRGKVDEIRAMADELGASVIVVDRALAPPQQRNLESIVGRPVNDRTGVILDIFAKHARSNEAKTQVEIARLEYLLPRLTGAWTHFQRQRGGVKARGMGETQIEVDRRRARERIARLKGQLQNFQRDRHVQRQARRGELQVALVGYTNSGKTSLMNALTHSELVAKDALFATLDSAVRTLDPATRPKILMTDTVGFIRNLPHSLVESFKSTLDEVLEADLLLHVVDLSHASYRVHMETTERVLQEIGAAEIPTMVVFNKMDRVDDPFLAKILRQAYSGSIAVSAFKDQDMVRLREHIYQFFAANFVHCRLRVPAENTQGLSTVYKNCLIVNTDFTEDGFVVFDVRVTKQSFARVKPFCLEASRSEDHNYAPRADATPAT